MRFLCSLLRRRFARAQVATSRDVGCFLSLLRMRDFGSQNAAPEGMWVQSGGIGLFLIRTAFSLLFTSVE